MHLHRTPSTAAATAALLVLLSACAPPATGTADDSGGTGLTGDGGVSDGGVSDGGTTDGGASDGGASDGGATDGGGTSGVDGGTTDGGTEAGPATITILFPETRDDVVICPTFVVVVDVDGLQLTDYREQSEHVDGQGHWHLFDSDSYVGAFVDSWGVVTLENDGSIDSHILTAKLSQNDHTAMGIESTVEVLVGPDGCVGGTSEPEGGEGDTGGKDSGT